MIVCSKCRREMTCVCTGKRVVFGADHVYAGDEFRCKECGATVVNTNKQPYNSPTVREEYPKRMILEMGEIT